MMTTGIENIVMDMATDTGQIVTETGGTEPEVQTGGDKKVADIDRITTEGGLHLVTEVMSIAESENGTGTGTDTGTGKAEDPHLQTDPTKKSTSEPAADLQVERRRELDGKMTEIDGLTIRILAKKRAIPQLRTKSQRRSCLTKMKKKKRICLNQSGFVVLIQKVTILMTPWIKWEILQLLGQVGSETCMKSLKKN